VHAKQNIDLLSLLKEKTKGNLTEDEGKLIDNLLHLLGLIFHGRLLLKNSIIILKKIGSNSPLHATLITIRFVMLILLKYHLKSSATLWHHDD